MPLLGFKKRFEQQIATGTKRQTIRAKRRDGRNPHPGDTLFLYVGLRTKSCHKIKEVKCESVEEIAIIRMSPLQVAVSIGGRFILYPEKEALAVADGFSSWQEMVDFFEKEHGIDENGFWGLLIRWGGGSLWTK